MVLCQKAAHNFVSTRVLCSLKFTKMCSFRAFDFFLYLRTRKFIFSSWKSYLHSSRHFCTKMLSEASIWHICLGTLVIFEDNLTIFSWNIFLVGQQILAFFNDTLWECIVEREFPSLRLSENREIVMYICSAYHITPFPLDFFSPSWSL